MDMDETQYQMIEQRGVQELVKVSLDENGLPCIFLRDVNKIFPNTTVISSYGMRIPFAIDNTRTPKQPLRIPYLENRVLEVESDNSALEWSREATAARIAAAAAAADAASGYVNTVHTAPLPGILDLDLDIHSYIDDEENAGGAGSDFSINMVESESSSEEEAEEEPPLVPHRSLISDTTATTTTINVSTTSSSSGTLRTVQSQNSITLETVPEHTLFTRNSPPSRTLRTVQSQNSIAETMPEHTLFARSSPPPFTHVPPTATSPTLNQQLSILEESEIEGDALPPPSYVLVDPGASQTTVTPESVNIIAPISAIDDPSERHLVRERVEIIKRVSQTILSQNYGAESCPHPPLFIVLPENPLRWSFSNILQNKIRLHFLCDCCEHQINTGDIASDQRLSSKRNVHVDLSKGFELRLDQFQDQMLLIKFGHYILSLLRMLQYGVSTDNVFVPAAFDRPVPPALSSGFLGGKTEMDPELFFRTKVNVERSIAFMEALLGDEYEEEAAEAVSFLDINDFRNLDWIVKRPPYAQAIKSEPANVGAASSSSSSATTTDADREHALSDIHSGGSGLYKVLGADKRVRWCCQKYYEIHYQRIDKNFSTKLEFLQMTLSPHTRSSVFVGTSENHLNTRIIAVSKIKGLFHVDITLDWDFERSHLHTLADMLRREATSVSSVAIRLSKRVPPLVWKKNLSIPDLDGYQAVDDHQPIMAIVNLIKNQRIKNLALEGDIDLMSIPNISTMDFTNLDILSIMKTNNRSSVGLNHMGSSGSSVHSNDTFDTTNNVSSNRGYHQDTYIPELVSFIQSCSFLVELSLGFSDAIPGHIRILQACVTGLTRLKRLDLFRVLGTKISTDTSSNNGGTRINRKLELSASLSSCRITRLFMDNCKANGEGKTKLLESLEELLTDDGAHIEDLELRFIGFNDKHAHALELGTRPVSEQHCTRLRRLVIHGNGLENRGVSAMRRILKRSTLHSSLNRHNRDVFSTGAGSLVNRNTSVGSSSSAQLAAAISTTSATRNLESFTYGNMWEQPALTHLELHIDSLTDYDWSNLLADLDLRRLITLHLEGVYFGDNAIAALAKPVGVENETFDYNSPPQSPVSDIYTHSSYASSPPTSFLPPAFISPSPLPLQTLRLSCSALSYDGIGHVQGFLSRLVHLSSISLHGFRKVRSENWVTIMGKIEFRWIEFVEIVSSGFDDTSAHCLAERIRSREQTPESPTGLTTTSGSTESAELNLPPYSAEPSTGAISTTAAATRVGTTTVVTTSAASSSSGTRALRRESISSRLFSPKQRSKDKDKEQPKSPSPSASTSSPTINSSQSSQKYLEIDLRYTDVTTKGLMHLRSIMTGQAQRVIVKSRDGEDEDGMDEVARLTAKLNEDKNWDDNLRPSVKGRTGASGTPNITEPPLSPSRHSFVNGILIWYTPVRREICALYLNEQELKLLISDLPDIDVDEMEEQYRIPEPYTRFISNPKLFGGQYVHLGYISQLQGISAQKFQVHKDFSWYVELL
ncbi:hypothetical protein BGZ46_009363 [Entomortierella lignicola]|nr:hypothetical protein BGZ46_009363 [Entomortierella lignicola]